MDGRNLAAITSIVFLRAIILEIEIECKVNTQVKKGVRIARETIKDECEPDAKFEWS